MALVFLKVLAQEYPIFFLTPQFSYLFLRLLFPLLHSSLTNSAPRWVLETFLAFSLMRGSVFLKCSQLISLFVGMVQLGHGCVFNELLLTSELVMYETLRQACLPVGRLREYVDQLPNQNKNHPGSGVCLELLCKSKPPYRVGDVCVRRRRSTFGWVVFSKLMCR